MNMKYIAGAMLAAFALSACDDSTDNIGTSLSDNNGVSIQSASYNVVSRSILADSVLANSIGGYLGKVKDPETGGYVTADYMTQFYTPEDYSFPSLSHLVTYDADGHTTLGSKGTIKADSCELRLFFDTFYGDSTQTMKLTAYEMSKPMNENRAYYSNFDPIAEGYVRTDGLKQDKVYNLVDYNVAKSIRDTNIYVPYITIKLNKPYTDKSGRTYSNYGSYILQKYYDDKANYKNALTFRNNVVPGFVVKMKGGLGNMAHIQTAQLNVYFKFNERVARTDSTSGKKVTTYHDSIYNAGSVFWGTEEVLQTTTITNDKAALAKLVNEDQTATYLKTPAGIFTELTLPVDEIMLNHEHDTIASAKVIVQRINNQVNSNTSFDVPRMLVMLPKDSLYTFFEKHQLYNNKTSYPATWGYTATSTNNSYTFGNISGLVSTMYRNKKKGVTSADWNKVVLVPIEITETKTAGSYYSQGTSTLTKVSNSMALGSTRLVRGTEQDSPIKIDVIYSKFK